MYMQLHMGYILINCNLIILINNESNVYITLKVEEVTFKSNSYYSSLSMCYSYVLATASKSN